MRNANRSSIFVKYRNDFPRNFSMCQRRLRVNHAETISSIENCVHTDGTVELQQPPPTPRGTADVAAVVAALFVIQ